MPAETLPESAPWAILADLKVGDRVAWYNRSYQGEQTFHYCYEATILKLCDEYMVMDKEDGPNWYYTDHHLVPVAKGVWNTQNRLLRV